MFTSGLSEIVLIVNDVRGSADFYREVVGLHPQTEASAEWAWFWTGSAGDSARLALHKGSLLFEDISPLPEGERWGHVHYAFRVSGDRLDEAIANVKAHGIEVHGPTAFEWMNATAYYFYDPDGNLLEFWSPHEDS